MDRQTRETWARIAMFAIPVAMIVGCRVGLRACVRFDLQRHATEEARSAADAGGGLGAAGAGAAGDGPDGGDPRAPR